MSLLSETDLSPWLVAFAQNIAMGLVLILIYNVIRTTARIERPFVTALLIGLLFGFGAVMSMNYPVRTPEGLSIDARTVFVLVGSLFGGPIGAVVAGIMAVVCRLAIGGPGAIPGVVTIVAAAALGAITARRYGDRVRDLRGHELFVIGLINTLLITVVVKVTAAIMGLPSLSLGPILAGFVIFPSGTLLLGSVFGMAHQRLVLRERQRLADIVETTSDLVWEVDAGRRLTFMSERHVEVLGMKPAEHIGKSPEAANSFWIDEATERAAKEVFERRQPYTNLMKRTITADGQVKILLLNGRPIFDDRGNFRGYRGTSRDITELERLTEELRRNRDGLVRAQKMGRIASAEVDLATGESAWSDEMYSLMGVDRAGGAGLSRYLPHIHPDDLPVYAHWRELNGRGEDSPPLEYRFIRPSDGEERWFHREAAIERDAQGRALKLYTTQQDITERRRAEDALRRSLRAQRIMSACNQLLIHAVDETRLIADVCRCICEIGGYELAWAGRVDHDAAKTITPIAACGARGTTDAEAYVRSLHITWSETDDRGKGPMGRAIRSGEIVLERDTEPTEDYAPWLDKVRQKGLRSTLTIPLKQGDRVFGALGIYATTIDAFDASETQTLAELGSDLAYGIASLRTRAARDQAERELEAAEEALQVIMDHTIDGLITIDERGMILTFSRPAEKIFGFTASEVIGQNVSMLMPQPFHGEHDGYIRRYLETGVPRVLGRGREVMGLRKDGSEFPMDLQIGELPGEQGGRFIGTVRDITARRETEAQLQQAQKMEAMGQLTGGVAHDFNNLLAVLLGRLQLLEQDLIDAPQLQDYVRSCIKAVDRGSTLTKSLLAFSRQQALKPTALDLNQVVDDMTDILRGALGEAFEFKVSKAADLWLTDADSGQLQNALLNLVLNARDAMSDGGTLNISTANTKLDEEYAASHRDVRAGDYVLLSVSDTGVGMTGDVVARVFEPFFSTKGVGKGSGLGLSMVYGFVKQSAGHVSIYSEVGKGTVVGLYLPRRYDAQVETKIAPVETGRPTGTETILLVEDNDDLRDLTRIQMQRLGYRVIDASDAHQGLRVLEQNPDIVLLLTDVILPLGLNGAEMAERALAMRPQLRVVFMSGYNEQHDVIAQALQRRPMRLLQKPFHVAELAAQLRAALD